MTNTQTTLPDGDTQELVERLADVFRTSEAGDLFTDDVFLDGHLPLWRFQLQGRDAFAGWLHNFASNDATIAVVSAVPTVNGFVAEFTGEHPADGDIITFRQLMLCDVRDGQISAMTLYCSGEFNAELRARHAAATTLIRPYRPRRADSPRT